MVQPINFFLHNLLFGIIRNYLTTILSLCSSQASDLSSVALISSKLYCCNCKDPGMSYSTNPLALTAREIQGLTEPNGLANISQELKS